MEYNDVKIKTNQILEMCECIICSGSFEKCHITKCGHSFCEKCILDCINLKNCCPTCKTPLKNEDIIHNFLVDDILKSIKEERAKEEYNNIENAYINNNLFDGGYRMNQIQTIFFENLKKIFTTYQNFLVTLEREKNTKIQSLTKYIEDVGLDLSEENQVKKIDFQDKITLEKERYNSILKDLESSLNQYMKNLPESPISLPIRTRIKFEERKILIDYLILMPTDPGSKLKDILSNYFRNLKDEILNFNDSYFYILKDNLKVIINHDKPLLSSGLTIGDSIYFEGDIVLKSEEKKNCFSLDFEKNTDKQQFVKYFTCLTCKNMKWICSECTNHCHKGHSVQIFKDNHLADWACCYCYKTNCILKNKYSS